MQTPSGLAGHEDGLGADALHRGGGSSRPLAAVNGPTQLVPPTSLLARRLNEKSSLTMLIIYTPTSLYSNTKFGSSNDRTMN